MQQYRKMESNSASVPSTKGSTGIEAAWKAGERETNAPCPRETAENMGTRETNVSEKDTAAARRDGGPPAIAAQQQRQEVVAVNKPPNRPTGFRRRRPSRPSHRQQVWILVMGRKSEGVGPTYPTPPEPERQQARLAGVVRPAAGDVNGIS